MLPFGIIILLAICRSGFSYLPTVCEDVKFNKTKPEKIKPIVILSGVGGGALNAKLTDVKEPYFFCRKNEDWFWLWINILDIIPFLSGECFKHNMQVDFDPSKNVSMNSQGVEITGRDYGGVGGLTYMSQLLHKESCYMEPLVKYLTEAGYTVGVDLRGAPYDWRLIPSDWTLRGIFEQYKKLVEETYNINNGTKVVLLSHSMGATFTSYFLANYVSQDWKNEYVEEFLSVSGPWDGAFFGMTYMLSGEIFGLPLNLREVAQGAPGMHWLLPSSIPKWLNYTFLTTNEKSYTMNQIHELWSDYTGDETPLQYIMYDFSRKQKKNVVPGVKTTCMYGSGWKTPQQYHFDNLKDRKYKITSFVDGDGLVYEDSLKLCDQWYLSQEEPVEVIVVEGMNHIMFVETQAGVEQVFDALYNEL